MTEYGINTHFTRENVSTTCPACGQPNTYNRKSDLCTTRRIDFRLVRCQHAECESPFAINGDIISPEAELLLLEAYSHCHQKEYSKCVTTITTAYDVLAKSAIRQIITGHIVLDDADPNWEEINKVNEELSERTRAWKAGKYRNAAANLLVRKPASTSTEARQLIDALPRLAEEPPDETTFGWSTRRSLG